MATAPDQAHPGSGNPAIAQDQVHPSASDITNGAPATDQSPNQFGVFELNITRIGPLV